jgi:hypothetical protein
MMRKNLHIPKCLFSLLSSGPIPESRRISTVSASKVVLQEIPEDLETAETIKEILQP